MTDQDLRGLAFRHCRGGPIDDSRASVYLQGFPGQAPGSDRPHFRQSSAVPDRLRVAMCDLPGAFATGFNLITAAPISDYSQNLACKFMEGLFWSCPTLSDFLQFAHGALQQMTAHPRPAVI